MSLPASLQTNRMTDATTGDQIDNKVSELEVALCDILGIPIDTPIVRPIPGSLAGLANEPNVSSTVVQTAVYAATIPGGTLGTDGMLQGHCDLFINSILDGGILEIRSFYTQLMLGIQLTNTSGSTQTSIPVRIDFRLGARNSVAAQRAFQSSCIGTQISTVSWGAVPSFWNHHGATFITVDSAVDQFFHIDVIWNTASAGNSINGEGFEIHRFR